MKRTVIFILVAMLFAGAVLFAPGFPTVRSVFVAEKNAVCVPVIMYHSVLRDRSKSGDYVITPQAVEEDFLYLCENGYETVTVADLIAYVDGKKTLPEKTVMITFDDGHFNNLTYVQPLLEKYHMRAVISVVGAYTEQFSTLPDPNPNYAYFSWEELRELANSGYFEIQNHSYNLHGELGSMRKKDESEEDYRKRFSDDLLKMQEALRKNSGIYPTAFTYPFGAISEESQKSLIEMGFRASFSTYEHRNVIVQGNPDSLFLLGRFNRPSGISTRDFMEKILNAPMRGTDSVLSNTEVLY